MNQRIQRIFAVLSLVISTACGKDGPAEPESPEPPPAPVPTRIVASPSSVTLDAIGQTVQLTAQVFDQYKAPMSGAVVIWTSGDDAVASVSAAGEVTAVGNGSAVIVSSSGDATASVDVTVLQTAYGIAIEPKSATLMAAGETVRLTATVLDRNEQPVDGVAISWTSSDTSVATVDDGGLVSAVGSGDARITASHGDLTDTAQIKVDIANPDRATLITLYNALGGPYWTRNTNWLSDLPLGAWHGVETDEDGRVTRLDLGFNGLVGVVPPELGNLTRLQELYLYDNDRLSCIIPPELGNLTSLRRLSMFEIPIVLAIFPPAWDPVPNPQCNIPPELGNLTNLEELHLGLTVLSGSIPSELGNLSSLQKLDLGYNALTGGIPAELGKLTNLRSLSLGYNKLSGGIPPELGSLANLQELNLSLSELSGSIPSELGSLARLQKLDLEFNRLSGSLPPELGNLSALTHLSLVDNEDLSGPLPDTFTSLENIQTLNLYLTGLCVPPDATFRAWLERIPDDPGVPFCREM